MSRSKHRAGWRLPPFGAHPDWYANRARHVLVVSFAWASIPIPKRVGLRLRIEAGGDNDFL